MSKESYMEVLNDLIERRARIDAAITAIREIAMTNGLAPVAEPLEKTATVPPDNRAERAAILRDTALRLAESGSVSASQIRDELLSQGDNRNMGTIRSCLTRLIESGKLVKVGFGTYKLGETGNERSEQAPERESEREAAPRKEPRVVSRRANQLADLVRGVLATSTAPMRLRDITAALAKVATPAPSMENVGSTLAVMTRKGELTRVSAGLYRISSE